MMSDDFSKHTNDFSSSDERWNMVMLVSGSMVKGGRLWVVKVYLLF